MDSLYDLFNRKKEACVLEERFEYEDQSVIMEDIIQESNMQFIQIQADSYVNELLIEEAMYNDFDEQYVHGLMESSFSEKKDKLIKFIQDKWAKLKAWFKRVVESIKNFFSRNKASLKTKDGKPVDNRIALEVLKSCEIEVTNPFANGMDMDLTDDWCIEQIDKLYELFNGYYSDKMSFNGLKERGLVILGVKDKKEIKSRIRKRYAAAVPTKVKIKDIPTKSLIAAGLGEKEMLEGIFEMRDSIDKEYAETLSKLKAYKEDGAENIDKKIAALNYITNLQGAVISAMIGSRKKLAADCRNIIKKALGTEESYNENK